MKHIFNILTSTVILLLLELNVSAQDLIRIQVFNESDLRRIAFSSTNEGRSYNDAIISLESDITIKGETWHPIGLPAVEGENSFPFQGEFDGKGHTITLDTSLEAIYCGNRCYAGLFGMVGKYGVVKNLIVRVNHVSISKVDGTNNGYLGIISGLSAGEIADCSVYGEISISSNELYNFFRFGSIAGFVQDGMVFNTENHANITTKNISCVGGIVGEMYGSILNNTFNTGTISANGFAEIGGDLKSVGGIAGTCNGHHEDDYSYLINCLNTGTLQVAENAISVGGVVGTCSSGIVFYSGNAGTITSDADYSGGVIGNMINSAVYGSYQAGKIRSKKKITSSNVIVGLKNWGDEEIVKDCYLLNTYESQHTHSGSISQEEFVNKANAVFPKQQKELLRIVEQAGCWKGTSKLFASKPWFFEQNQSFPSFKK